MANNEVAVYVEPHLADPAQLNDWNKMLLLDNSFVTQFSLYSPCEDLHKGEQKDGTRTFAEFPDQYISRLTIS